MPTANIPTKTTGPDITKFHVEPPGAEGIKIWSNCLGYMTKMATMPLYGKLFKNLQN